MIAYLEKHDTTVEVPDDLGEKDLADISNNFEKYVQPPQAKNQNLTTDVKSPSSTTAVPKTPIPTGIPGVDLPQSTDGLPDMPKWVPDFYEAHIKPLINSIGPIGLPAQLESLPEAQRGPIEAFTTSAFKQLTAGLTTPLLRGVDQEEKDHPISHFGGALTGGLGSLLVAGGALRVAGLAPIAEEAGKVGVEAGIASASRFVPRAIMTGATFGTQAFVTHVIKAFQDGDVDLAQFGKDVLSQTAGGATFGAIGGVANVPLSVASAGGLGFVMSKMEGGDNREAALNAGLFAGFEFIGSFGKNKALIGEGIKNIEDSIDDYVKAKNPDLAPSGGAGHAIVTLEAQKYGGIEEMAKKENALQLVEDINQRIRQGKVPAPIQNVEAQPQIEASPSQPSERTSRQPIEPSLQGQEENGPEQAKTLGEVFPLTDVSSDPSIAQHPDFIQMTNDAKSIIDKYAEERNVLPSNEFATSLYHEFHDALGRIQKADAADRPAVIEQIRTEYPDIEREFATLSTKLWSDKTDQFFNRQVAGKYGSLRPKVATDLETAHQAQLKSLTDAIAEGAKPSEIFTKTTEALQGIQPKPEKALKFDDQGIPVRKPGSVVASVPTADGGIAKITHKMVLDEAAGLLQEAKDRRGTTDPVVEFVRNNGGLKGFKGGMESEEFKGVPIHVRGIVSADEMAQMAYDRNLIEEPSADLLRNHLASIPPKGPEPKLADFYDQAQNNLEQHFSSYQAPEEYNGEYHVGLFEKGPQYGEKTSTPEFKKWFGDSKVVNEKGGPLVVYSGHSNVSLFGTQFEPAKATSGGFFFTDDPAIASNYATGKIGVKEYYEHGEEYRIAGNNGKFSKRLYSVTLSQAQISQAKNFLNDLGFEWDRIVENSPYDKEARRLSSNPSNLQNYFDYLEGMGHTLRYPEEGNEPLAFRQKNSDFEDLLDALGVKWNSRLKSVPGTIPTYLSIKNPIDTSKPFPADLLQALKDASKREHNVSESEALDLKWTKEYPLKNWVKDIGSGDEFWSTHVPEKALPIIKQFGYDGIKDTGGKMGGDAHHVWVALDPTQIKSSTGNSGAFDANNPNILKEPSARGQQELNFDSPYEEDKGNQVPREQGETETTQPTVRGGFRAIQEPHLEVEFKQNGFLVFPNRKIESPADLAYGFKFLHNEAQENFFIGAIKNDRIVSVEHLAVGTIDQVAVYPYETINHIDQQNADSFFIVHNHPSGHVVPSEEDISLTRTLRKVMENNGVQFRGHVIIDDTKFGFIDPDGNTTQKEHHEGPKTEQVPILKKFYEWLRPKSDIEKNPVVTTPEKAFELFKGIQRGRTEAIVHLLNVQNVLLNSIVIPQNHMNAGTLQRLATAYRAGSVIAVNSGLSDAAFMDMKLGLERAGIRTLDDIELSNDQTGFRTKRGRGLFEKKSEYGNEPEKSLFPEDKENVADRYARLRQEAIAQGLNPAQASKWAKDNLANNQLATPSGVRMKQQEFGSAGGVEGFGQGRQGEQSLFEPKSPYGEKEISQQMKESAEEIKSIVNPTSAAPLATQITREQLGKMARAYDKAEAVLENASKLFSKQTNEQNTDFIDRMERGLVQTTPALEKIAKQLRIILDEKRTEIRSLGTGKLENFIENYFPHIWDQGEKSVSVAVQKAAKRPFEGSKSFLKKRTIDFFKEGIELGLTPISFNPVDLVLLKGREMDKYIAAHRTLNAYKENGLAQFVKLGGDRPADWIKIDDKIATVQHMTPQGLVITGHYYAQADAARIINNYLSPGLQKSPTYRAFRYAGNLLNQFQLGFSAFHLGFTSMDAIVSKNALALNQLWKGHPLKAIQAALSSPAAPITNIIRGDKLFKAWRGDGEFASGVEEVMAQAMASAGGRSRMDQFYATKASDQMMKYFKAGKPLRGILNLPLSLVEATTKPILEYIVPRQKLGIFADIMKMEMEHNPNMTHDEMRAIAQKAWDSVDNRMGQLVYDNLFWNRTFKDSLMASVRSVGWNLGTIREIGGGTIDAARMIEDLSKGKKTDLSYRTSYVIMLTITAGIGGAIYQYLKTGKGPQELKDYFHPRNGGTDANGNPTRTDLPTYMKDIFAYTTDPLKTVQNKLNPLLSIMSQMLHNQDYYGVKIRNEDDPVVKQALSDATFILKQIEPFSIRNMQHNRQLGNKSLADNIEPWIGFTPSRYDINQTKAERLAHEISASHQPIGGRTQAQADQSRLLGDLGRRYRAGDPEAQDDLIKAYQAGQITRTQMRNVISHANLTPLQRAVQHFSAEETQRVYDKSTDEEKAQIERILERKKMSQRVPVEAP